MLPETKTRAGRQCATVRPRKITSGVREKSTTSVSVPIGRSGISHQIARMPVDIFHSWNEWGYGWRRGLMSKVEVPRRSSQSDFRSRCVSSDAT